MQSYQGRARVKMAFVSQKQRLGIAVCQIRLLLGDLLFRQGGSTWRTARKSRQVALISTKRHYKRSLMMDRSPLAFPPSGGFAALTHDLGLSTDPFAIRREHAAGPPRARMIARRAFWINDCDLGAT